MEDQYRDLEPKVRQLAQLVFELTRGLKYLLDRHHEVSRSGPMGGEIQHPTAAERADELHVTLIATQRLFGVAVLQSRNRETL